MFNRKSSDSKQKSIADKLINNIDQLDGDEIEALYDQLDADHQELVDPVIREFADAAVGSEHWDSDD